MSNFLSNQLRYGLQRDNAGRRAPLSPEMIAERQRVEDDRLSASVIANVSQARKNLVRMTRRIHDPVIRANVVAELESLRDELSIGLKELADTNDTNRTKLNHGDTEFTEKERQA